MEDLSFYIGRLYYRYVEVLKHLLNKYGLDSHLRPGMGHALFALFQEEGRTMTELGQATDLVPSTVTEMVQKMERSGIVRRERCSTDGRAMRVYLTKEGHALRTKCRKLSAELNGILQADQTIEETLQVKKACARMIQSLKEVVPPTPVRNRQK